MGEIELSVTVKENCSVQDSIKSGDVQSINNLVVETSTIGDKILLVDDQTFNLEALKINLKLKGVQELFEEAESDDEIVSRESNADIRVLKKSDTREMILPSSMLDSIDTRHQLLRNQSDYFYQPTFKKSELASYKRVDTAMTGHEALNLVKKLWEEHGKLYRVVFMDCDMPVMDGYQCT